MTSHLADGAATGAALADRIAFDGVVDNVGLVRPQWLGAVGISALDEVLRVNLHPALRAVQALLPGMRQRGWGRGRRRRQPDRPRQHRAHGLRGRQGGARQRHLLPGARTGHDPDHRR
jgi:NAD(P)-dependent dehydrogenase (short-subunit alcohol dehydrogenase family)